MQPRQFLKLSTLLLASGSGPVWSSEAVSRSRPLLPVPPLLEPDIHQQIHLTAMAGMTCWRGHQVGTWGYNGNLLGPALRLQRHQLTTVSIHNQLPQSTTLHWHGLIVGETLMVGRMK